MPCYRINWDNRDRVFGKRRRFDKTYFLCFIAWLPVTVAADGCRLETLSEVDIVSKLIQVDTTIVEYCWYCDTAEPLPLRVGKIEFRHTEPLQVRAIAWTDDATERLFPLNTLEQGERDGTGALADFIRQDVNQQHSDTSGYFGHNDPYLVQEKKDQFAMLLRVVREDHDMRTFDEFYINDEPADPRLLYVPVGEGQFQSVGRQLDCLMDNAPDFVAFRPVDRDPGKTAPPMPFIADITGQCYDGACPQNVWRVIRQTPLLTDAQDNAPQIDMLESGENLVPVKTETHVTGSQIIATKDHGKFFAGDVFYLLDSQAEGFYRVWHYGDVFTIDAAGINLDDLTDRCERDETCWASGMGYPTEVWWSKIRRASGEEGWVREPIRNLDGVLRSD